MKKWDCKEVSLLKELYSTTTNKDLARMLNRTTRAIAWQAHKLGLKKESECLFRCNSDYYHLYNEWAELYLGGKSTYEIGKMHSVSDETIRNALLQMGISIRSRSEAAQKYAHLYLEWIELYKKGFNSNEIAERYKCSNATVLRAIREHTQIRSNSEAQRKYEIRNERYFSAINSPSKAYWLGFLMADGCISTDNKKTYLVAVNISAKDIEILEALRKELGCEHPIKKPMHNGREMASLFINSKQMVADLIMQGCVPRKTGILTFPDVAPNYYSHLIRGYFDGDGCVSINKSRGASWGIVGTQSFLESVRDIFVDTLGLKKIKLYKIKRAANTYELKYGGNRQVRIIRDWLYKDAEFALSRKREKLFSIG